ncbi:uncharacterized protein EI97DRAFT_438471 [Westerdykella ornata]|uniref:Uncharacterized protein n=1 Tax=Westerdykella ornata TaxID=318751 RepID=A0A6A6K145_WESOR|nr:uncharacterized protein EI97DRAFT_438471 [Westerdykella ornata]KAF2281069.1 hypothetical protein EI97DRAFT_438471 [Westerdykella ornata]
MSIYEYYGVSRCCCHDETPTYDWDHPHSVSPLDEDGEHPRDYFAPRPPPRRQPRRHQANHRGLGYQAYQPSYDYRTYANFGGSGPGGFRGSSAWEQYEDPRDYRSYGGWRGQGAGREGYSWGRDGGHYGRFC